MKKFINNVDNIVTEMIDGLVMSNPETLKRVEGYDVVYRKNTKKDKVSLVSGGGSGHEPTHAGYVGKGMLDAAVCGPVFTSPTPDQILEGIKATTGDKGSLLVIKNYTGDVMNFEMAMQMAQAEGLNVERVVVDDDIALENSTFTTGRRGIAGTIFVHKLAGAKAESGADLKDVKAVAEKVIENVASYGIGLDGCTVPANGKKGFDIPDGEMEIGLGIHGEPGIKRDKMLSADDSVELLMGYINKHLKLKENDKVAVMINGLGATPLMELNILSRKALLMLEDMNVKVVKTFVGNFMTAIDMPGFSLSILKLDDELEKLLLAPADTVGMKVS